MTFCCCCEVVGIYGEISVSGTVATLIGVACGVAGVLGTCGLLSPGMLGNGGVSIGTDGGLTVGGGGVTGGGVEGVTCEGGVQFSAGTEAPVSSAMVNWMGLFSIFLFTLGVAK